MTDKQMLEFNINLHGLAKMATIDALLYPAKYTMNYIYALVLYFLYSRWSLRVSGKYIGTEPSITHFSCYFCVLSLPLSLSLILSLPPYLSLILSLPHSLLFYLSISLSYTLSLSLSLSLSYALYRSYSLSVIIFLYLYLSHFISLPYSL